MPIATLNGLIKSPITYSGASCSRDIRRASRVRPGRRSAVIRSTRTQCWATEKACSPLVWPFQRATRARPWAMSSISTSSGDGSSRSRRRALSMRCQARGGCLGMRVLESGRVFTLKAVPGARLADLPSGTGGACRNGASGYGVGMRVKPLEAERLRPVTNPARLPFESPASLPEPTGPVGQDRAMRALHFGAGMAQPGYNIFVTGPAGSGKRNSVKRALQRLAPAMPAPPDIAYVHNFMAAHRPRVLRFAAGDGARFRAAMAEFAASLK